MEHIIFLSRQLYESILGSTFICEAFNLKVHCPPPSGSLIFTTGNGLFACRQGIVSLLVVHIRCFPGSATCSSFKHRTSSLGVRTGSAPRFAHRLLMAAEPRPQARKPCLLSKIEGFQEVVTTAVIIPKEDGVISVSEDR